MLLCFGGFTGSGRRMLAMRFARRTGFHFYDSDTHKVHIHPRNFRGEVIDGILPPSTDEERLKIIKKDIADLSFAAKMHTNIVYDDDLHRKIPRELFLSEARKIFGDVLFIWVDSDEEHVMNRLRHRMRLGVIRNLRRALALRETEKAEYEPLPEGMKDVVTYFINLSNNAAVDRLIALIADRLPPVAATSKSR